MITKEQAEKFYNEIEEVCKKHNISISHEDGHGGFLLEPYEDFYMKWMRTTILYDDDGNYIDDFKIYFSEEKDSKGDFK